MKITFLAYIYPYPYRGFNPGIERVVEQFAQELVNQGHEVHVITTFRNGGSAKLEHDNGVIIHRVPDTRRYLGRVGSTFSLDLLSINFSSYTYNELLNESDIVHAFTPIVWKHFSTPMVAHYHHWDEPNDPIEYLYLPTTHQLWLRCYRISDRVVAVSNYSANDLVERGIDPESIETVPNGVDTDTFSPGSSSIIIEDWEATLLYVGPITERKGLEYLIKAMPDILMGHESTGLIIVGGGDNTELIELAETLGIRNRIRFEGFVSDKDLPEYYRAADIFVFPSLLEGFGMVLLEAMASGLPIVSTDSSAIPEVVGEAGRLVPPRQSAELAEQVLYLLKNDNADKYSNKSMRRARNEFSWEKSANELVEVYRTLRN